MFTDLLKTSLKKVSNWKTPGHDGIHGFWFKKFTFIHDRLALEMNKCLQTAHVPERMTKGRTTLIQKDPNKGTAPSNYRPITCLPMMWKISSAQIREEIYYLLTTRGLYPIEQKGCCKGFRGTEELLHIDQHILNESKTRRKNLAMAWIDYKKAYDMVPHGWIINSLKMCKISDEVINFIDKTMKTWRVELTAGGRRLAEAKIQRDTLLPLIFIIAMMPLNHILRKCTAGYKLNRSQEKVNHLMYMDDIKLFAKNDKELETRINTVRIYSRDIGMKFDIEKCSMLVMKSGKQQLTDGMELPNQDNIKTLAENETYKYLGILEADTIKKSGNERQNSKRNISVELKKLLETKLNSRNLIKGINTWAVPPVRYSGPFLKWTRNELKPMDQRTRKLISIHKALHHRDDVDRIYVSRKEGGRRLASIEDSVDATIRRLYTKTRWRTHYSHQKRYWEHYEQQNDNN